MSIFVLLKKADVVVSRNLTNTISLAQQDFGKQAFEDTTKQAFTCPEIHLSILCYTCKPVREQ